MIVYIYETIEDYFIYISILYCSGLMIKYISFFLPRQMITGENIDKTLPP